MAPLHNGMTFPTDLYLYTDTHAGENASHTHTSKNAVIITLLAMIGKDPDMRR